MARITPPKDHAEKVARLRQVLAAIEANPQHWDQAEWHCGTTHCFAGFAQLIAYGLSPSIDIDDDIDDFDPYKFFQDVHCDACYWLGLSQRQSVELFNPRNTLDDLRVVVDDIAAAQPVKGRA